MAAAVAVEHLRDAVDLGGLELAGGLADAQHCCDDNQETSF
jgi:hypothetical protein